MYCIGFDIGGTKCAVSLGKIEKGEIEILGREETPTLPSAEETLENLALAVKSFQLGREIVAAGISCGGPLDSVKGVIVSPPNLPHWHGFAIVDYIQKRFGLKAKLQNDANACAVAEWKFGAGKGTKNMVFMTFGTGLGAGLILDGKLYSGTNDNAGEAGHIRLAKRGPIGYGKEGSFEGFCSGGGIAQLAKIMALRAKKIPDSIVEMGGVSEITTKKLAQKAFAGDKFCKRVFAKSGELLGKGLSILIDLLNPEKIVLGGVFMRSSELLVPSMRKQIEKEALDVSAQVCEIVPAKLSENIGDIAALAIAASEIGA
ncbi:MAG: ROK family protein [Clostridia bacterium]|nr:ROK family protein [Clostridia bacterium]